MEGAEQNPPSPNTGINKPEKAMENGKQKKNPIKNWMIEVNSREEMRGIK